MLRSLFITGAGGYVGTRVLQLLDSARYTQVICLARGEILTGAPNVRWLAGDLLDARTYADAVESCDTVVHLAAATGSKPAGEDFRVNTEGTRMLVEAFKRAGVQNFLHISTIATSFTSYLRFYPYARSKLAAEEIVRASGIRFAIVRPSIVIGRRAPALEGLSKLAAAPVLPMFGNGRVAVQPVYVDDLVAVLLSLVDEDGFEGRTYEVGGPQVLTMKEFLLMIRRIRYRKGPSAVHIPLAPLIALLAVSEKILGSALPLTAGQLTSFANDSSSKAHPRLERRRA